MKKLINPNTDSYCDLGPDRKHNPSLTLI